MRIYLFNSIILFFTLLFAQNVYAFELDLERVEIISYDENYVQNASCSVRRYSRRGKRVLNVFGTTLQTWTNNVTLTATFEEFLHNEYRPSFVKFQFKLCDLFDSPYLLLKKRFGLECPMLPGNYSVCNVTVISEDFPNVFPMEKGRIHVVFSLTKTGLAIATGYLYASFANRH